MNRIGLSLRCDHVRSLAMSGKEQGTVFDIGQSGLLEGQSPLAGMIQGLRGNGIRPAQAQDPLDP